LGGVVGGRSPGRDRDRHIFKLLDTGFAALKNKTAPVNTLDDAPLFAPAREQTADESEKQYRDRRIQARKLSESLDAIASLEQSLQTKEDGNVVKNAIIDWGRKRP